MEEMVNVKLDRYDSLVDSETRLSVLRMECVRILEEREKRHKEEPGNFYKVSNAEISISKVLDIIGAFKTIDGFKLREEEYDRSVSEQPG